MKRGEVRWFRFAPPDKRRPVVILTRDSAIPYMHEITVASVTTTLRAIPTEVFLEPSEGLPKDCAVNLDHLQTVPKAKIGELITSLSNERMIEVEVAIRFALGFAKVEAAKPAARRPPAVRRKQSPPWRAACMARTHTPTRSTRKPPLRCYTLPQSASPVTEQGSMPGAYAYTPAIWLPLAGVAFAVGMALYCWRRRDVPAVWPLFFVFVITALLCLASALSVGRA